MAIDALTNVLRMYHGLSRFLKSWTIGTKDRDSVTEALERPCMTTEYGTLNKTAVSSNVSTCVGKMFTCLRVYLIFIVQKTMKAVNINVWSGAVFGVKFQRKSGAASLMAQRFRAMLVKQVIYYWRNCIIMLIVMLFPVFETIFACYSATLHPSKTDPPPLPLNLSYFDKSTVLFTSVGPGSVSLAKSYSEVASRYGQTRDVGKDNMDDSLLEIAKRSLEDYNKRHIVAATALSNGNDSLIGHFNNFALHSIAISLSLVDNALLLYAVPGSPPIVTINHPLPRAASTRISDAQKSSATFMFSLLVPCGLLFVGCMFVVFMVKQRSTKSKRCQLVSGVNAVIYWLSAVIWGLALFAISSILTVIVVLAFQLKPYSSWPLYRQVKFRRFLRILPRCMECRRGPAMRILSVCSSVCQTCAL